MTHFMHEGNHYAVVPHAALDITDHLPLGTYKVNFNPMTNSFFLEKIEDFVIAGRIYGNTVAYRDRILTTFTDRDATTGVLLTGEKGSGKTLLAKMVALEAQERGIPTLVINSPWCGDQFNAFMQSINQPIVVIFDEFEKVYDADDQKKLLTLLDGTYTSKKLFMLTANDRYKVDEHMKNRPGRISYGLDFSGVDTDFVREYCQDNLKNTDYIEDVVATSRLFQRFNFDVLKAIVEEMNRFDEPVESALLMLNAQPERGVKLNYVVTLTVDGELVSKDALDDAAEWYGNPLTDRMSFWLHRRDVPALEAKRKNEDDDHARVDVTPQDLVQINKDTGDFTYAKGEYRLTLSEKLFVSNINKALVY